jgi:tetratricopeptide (TPR) repeat protein
MRAFAALTALVILLAIGLSLLVLPSDEEVGIMLLRDRKYEAARSYFEKQVEAGDLSAPTVSAMLKIHVEYGDVERAIALIERLDGAFGGSAAILAQLAELYRADRRFGLYLRTMERLVAIQPTQDRLETLADAYYKAGDLDARIAVLSKLRELELITVELLIELSELLKVRGRFEEATSALFKADAREPDALDWSQRRTLFDMMLEHGKAGQTRDLLARWIDRETPNAALIALAQIAIMHGETGLAIEMLKRRPELETTDHNWRSTLIFGLRTARREEEAWRHLRDWLEDEILPLTLGADLIDLAVRNQDLSLALRTVDQLGIDMFGTEPILGLVGALHGAGRGGDVDRLLAELGPGALDASPILGAEIALVRRNLEQASRYADMALAKVRGDRNTLGQGSVATSLDERVTLASVLASLNRSEDALELLVAIMTNPALPAEGMILLGELYAKLGQAEDGYWDITALLSRQNSPRLRAVWANLALLTDRRDVVLDWLGRETNIDPLFLSDLYFLAESRDAWDVAIAAAKRMIIATPGADADIRLAYALFKGGRPRDALTIIAPVVPRNPQSEPLYADILRALGRTKDLILLWRVQIARPGISADRREELVYALLEAGADDAVLQDLKDFATQRGGFWWSTLANSAARLDRLDDLVPMMVERIKASAPSSDETSAILYALADVDRAGALPAYRDLANRAPRLWADAYLSTLRDLGQIEELVDWTNERLGKETDPIQALSFAYALADLTTADAAARAIEPLADRSVDLAGLYTELLRRAGRDSDALRFEIRIASAGTFGAEYTQGVAFRALEAGDRGTAETLFRSIADRAGPDSAVMRQLLYLWGPRPRPAVLDWIEARARKADGEQRQAWLDILLRMRAGNRTAGVIGGVEGANNEDDLLRLVKALAQDRSNDRNKRKLQDALAKAIERAASLKTLTELARIAEQIRDRGLIRKAWQAVLKSAPKDPTAHRSLGLAAYDEGRLIDAERHLGAYLSLGDGDYEANYFFGDTLARTDRATYSIPFFKKAQAQLLAKPKRDFHEELTRANLLRRLGKVEDAVKLMEGLLEQRPTDRALRADLADLLIEKGDLKRARDILRQR